MLAGRARWFVAAAALAAAALWVYYEALDAYFFDDDFQWLVGSWSFSPASLIDIQRITHFYRPVIDLYFAVATPLFSGSPVLFHAASLALHVVNGVLLLAVASAISERFVFAFSAALFFVVQPADVDAVAWVGALAEPLSAGFGCLALLGLLQHRRRGGRAWHVLSVAAFTLALLTHESAVMVLPLMLLADRTVAAAMRGDAAERARDLRSFMPHTMVLGAYLAVNVYVNSRNYVITDGYYAIGPHALTNALEYVTALYVGRQDVFNYAMVAFVVPLLLVRGSACVRFATGWLLLALLPFLFFTWGTRSRYLYLAAMGFSLLLANGILRIDSALTRWLRPGGRAAAIGILVAALTVRFMVFASDNVRSFSERTDVYRRYAATFREIHGELPPYARVRPDERLRIDHEHRFINALIQWEYRDPTIEVLPTGP